MTKGKNSGKTRNAVEESKTDKQAEAHTEYMIQLYNKMDTNKSGFLLESNFKSYLESQGLSEDEIGNKAIKYFSECDKDHSGVVSIQEFLEWG